MLTLKVTWGLAHLIIDIFYVNQSLKATHARSLPPMKRSIFILLTTWFGVVHVAQAQLTELSSASREQQLVEIVGIERLPASTVLPSATRFQDVVELMQTGTGNTARIDQQSLSSNANQAYVAQVGTANVLGLSQKGSNNSLYINQNGGNNHTDFTQNGRNNATTINQNGSQNRVEGVNKGTDMLVEGDNNTLKITQSGEYNTVRSEIRESKRSYEIRQYGYDNTLTQVESTQSTPVGYSVEMRGRGINLTIEQSRVR